MKTTKNLFLFFMFFILFLNLNVFAEELNNESIADPNNTNEETTEKLTTNEDESNIENEEINTEYLKTEETKEIKQQQTKVKISKVNEKNELIANAILQIIDSNGNVVEEWTTDGTVYEIMLPAGKYTLHEVEAPEGYEKALDKEFEVDVIIEEEIIAGTNWDEIPCNHGDRRQTPLYYIEIDSISYEVYCINQGVQEPYDIEYKGEIITVNNIRNYTKQETNVDAEGYTISGTRINANTETITDYDVSDQTMSNQELYDKALDIIYHRTLAANDERFSDLSVSEIRYITEIALKNYLNAGITTYETIRELKGTKIDHIRYNVNGDVWQEGDGTKYLKLYNKPFLREYTYDANSPTGYIITPGNGDALGNFAKHWYEGHGKQIIPQKYVELYQYLISEENKHPESMQLFIYSPTNVNSEEPYQNLLGIVGFIENIETIEQNVEMKNNYSTEKRDIIVEKVWEDNAENTNDEKPNSVTVNLYADEKLHESVELKEENNWKYTFEDLEMYKEGNKIIYTIDEVEVPQYETIIEGNMDEGFKITNVKTYIPEEDIQDPENIKNPSTGDEISNQFILTIISLTGLLLSTVYLAKNK